MIDITACAVATGIMQSCPADALNLRLHLLPGDLHIKCATACSAIYVIWDVGQQNLTAICKASFKRNFAVVLPIRAGILATCPKVIAS